VGHPPGGRQLEREQGQQVSSGGDRRGPGVAGRGDQGGQVEGDQVGDGQQQPGHGGVSTRGQGGEVGGAGGRQPGVAPGGGRAGAGLGCGAAQQPAEPFLAQDAADGGAAQRGALLAEPGADLIDRQAVTAQLDDPAAGGVFPRGALAAGGSRRREHGELSRPRVPDQRRERVAGVAGGVGCLLQRGALEQVGAQRLLPPLVHLPGQQLPARSWGRYGGHPADLSQDRASRRDPVSARIRRSRARLPSSGVIQNRAFHPHMPMYHVDNDLCSGGIVRYPTPDN
jgi:hypothetical protein